MMRQIPYVPLKNSKQLGHKLNIAVGQRTEIAINIRTDDGMTNGASNVIKHTHLTNDSKPSGLVWVQFDYDDAGRKLNKKIETFTQEVYQILGILLNPLQLNLL